MALTDKLTAIGNAIRAKTGDTALIPLSDMATAIANIPSGGGYTEVPEKDVNFYDYDGTCLYSYTIDELHALTALPPNPEHEGLTSQGWNWTLGELKAQNRQAEVGQVYITDDGATRIHISLVADLGVGLLLSALGTTIDWGDGFSQPWTNSILFEHVYAAPGDYVIRIIPDTPTTKWHPDFRTSNSSYGFVVGGASYSDIPNDSSGCVKKIFFGTGLDGNKIYDYTVRYMPSLEICTIPDYVISIGIGNFAYTRALRHITFPRGITTVPNYSVYYCESLRTISYPPTIATLYNTYNNDNRIKRISFPDSISQAAFNAICYSYPCMRAVSLPANITSIGSNAFFGCSALESLAIPGNVVSIGSSAVSDCNSLVELHCKPFTPPTLDTSNVFRGMRSTCVIYVPPGSLAAYQSATNWSTHASKMQEEQE